MLSPRAMVAAIVLAVLSLCGEKMVSNFDTPDWQGASYAASSTVPATALYQLATGVHLTVIAAAANKRILILGITWNRADNSANLIVLQSTGHQFVLAYVCRGLAAFHEPMYGLQLPTGEGLELFNSVGGGMAAQDNITIYYQVQ